MLREFSTDEYWTLFIHSSTKLLCELVGVVEVRQCVEFGPTIAGSRDVPFAVAVETDRSPVTDVDQLAARTPPPFPVQWDMPLWIDVRDC